MRALALNFLIANIWMMLNEASLFTVVTGFLLGFGMLTIFPGVWGSREYVRRSLAGAKFIGVFGREFFLSCWQLFKISLSPSMNNLYPRVITYDVAGLSKLEILLLSHCISLTPGTTTIDVAANFEYLTLHVLDAPDPAAVRKGIDETLKRGILAFTR